VRHQYRSAEISAYVVGILLTVLVLLFWPALMLLAGVLSCPGFTVWTMLAIILAGISALYLGLLPPFVEIIQVWPSKTPDYTTDSDNNFYGPRSANV